MKAKKSFGQHFLNRKEIAIQIAGSLKETSRYNMVLEVGPGRGMLTQYLLEGEYELFVVEADRDMVLYLQKHFPALKNKIIAADFLKLPLDEIMEHQSFGLIGNFPYNISTQILFKMLEYRKYIPEMVGMFQKEVGMRVVADPGSKTYGVTSVLLQAFYKGEYLFTVDNTCFTPPPKVQSAVIRLTRNENQELGCDEKLFRSVVKQAFSQRRKMLRNTMKPFLIGNPIMETDLFSLRPEKLSVDDFVMLTQLIESTKNN